MSTDGENPAASTDQETGAERTSSADSESPLLNSSRPTWLLVLALAWPVWIQQLLMMAVRLYDYYLAGNNTPDDSSIPLKSYQAAQTTANYLGWSIANCSVLVSVGSTALIARFKGAGDGKNAVHATNQSIMLAIVFGLAATVLGLAFVDQSVELLQMEGPSAKLCVAFLIPVLALFVFQMIESVGLACLVGAGDTRPTLWVLGGVAIANMPLAWICFHGLGPIPGFGFPGIALGTAISHTLGGIAVLSLLVRGRAGLKLRFKEMLPDLHLVRRLLRISIPATADTVSICLCQLWFLGLVNRLGPVATAAHGIAIQWESLGFLSGQAFATAAAALVGQNLGARRPEQAARNGWITWGIGCGIMTTMGLIFFIFAPEMFALFCPEKDQREIIVAGIPILRLVAFAMPPLACIIIFTGALRGAGDTRLPMIVSWIGFLGIRIPLAFLLIFSTVDLGPLGKISGLGMGLYGAWLAMFFDLLTRGALFLARFAGGSWKRTKV
jgi:putative MATE family efflux protein